MIQKMIQKIIHHHNYVQMLKKMQFLNFFRILNKRIAIKKFKEKLHIPKRHPIRRV